MYWMRSLHDYLSYWSNWKNKKKIGTIYSGSNYNLDFFSAETEIGVEEESPVVNALKDNIKNKEQNYDFIMIDTSPGTHCNVISALQNYELAFLCYRTDPAWSPWFRIKFKIIKKLKYFWKPNPLNDEEAKEFKVKCLDFYQKKTLKRIKNYFVKFNYDDKFNTKIETEQKNKTADGDEYEEITDFAEIMWG